MIKGNKLKDLTLPAVLSMISEYDIYRMYIGYDFKLDRAFHSPFREGDEHPSFSVFPSPDGTLAYIDYGDDRWKGKGPAKFVMQKFNLSFNEALEKIDRDFQLGFRGKKGNTKEITSSYRAPKIDREVADTVIQVKTRKWKQEELDYWAQYGIEKSDFRQKDFSVHVPQDVWINKKRLGLRNQMVFCYFFMEKYWKIYFPFERRERKWLSNVPTDVMYELGNINNCDKAIVTKSVKDLLVLRKFYPYVCSTQNESRKAINQENVKYLRENSKEVYIAFDSDIAGKENSWHYTKTYGFKHINPPDRLLAEGVKDFSGWVALEGMEVVRQYLIKKHIL